jgi:hypothetical protein
LKKAQEKVCKRFNADFFQAINSIYGYDSTVTTAGQEWTNGLNSNFALKLGFTRNLVFTAW